MVYVSQQDNDASADDVIVHPIHSNLDLHTFCPKDIPSLISEYLYECLARDIKHVRIVHGNRAGVLRDAVHKILQQLPVVVEYAIAPIHEGGFGATIVSLC